MITIKEEDLKDLLRKRENHIKAKSSMTELFIGFVVYMVSVLLSEVWTKSPVIIAVTAIISIFYLAYIFSRIFNFASHKYTLEKFYKEIKDNTQGIHEHTLLIVTEEGNKDRYLLKCDDRWDNNFLFPHFPTKTENNKNYVNEYLQNNGFTVVSVGEPKEDTYTKFSLSANRNKTYHHMFYPVTIAHKDKLDKSYKWMTTEEMKKDDKMMEANGETISYISHNF